jgi:hypothetical protein
VATSGEYSGDGNEAEEDETRAARREWCLRERNRTERGFCREPYRHCPGKKDRHDIARQKHRESCRYASSVTPNCVWPTLAQC